MKQSGGRPGSCWVLPFSPSLLVGGAASLVWYCFHHFFLWECAAFLLPPSGGGAFL